MEVDGSGGRRRDLDLGGGIQSPSSSSLELAVATVIPNGERRDSERSRGGGTVTAMATAVAYGNDLPGVIVVFSVGCGECDPVRRTARQRKISWRRDGDSGGGRDHDGRRGQMQTGKGREPAWRRTTTALLWHNC
jgi:hypothetical protein